MAGHTLLILLLTALESAQAVSILEDPGFQGGFRLSAVRSSAQPVEVGRVLALNDTAEPKWRLCQWGTKFSLEQAVEERTVAGARRLANAAKEAIVYPGGLEGGGLRLAVNGGVEYGDQPRVQGQPWVHLLIEQNLNKVRLSGMKSLEFSLEFRVEACKPATDKPMDPGLHTAHVTAFWTIHNANPASADFNDMIWFGVPLFDARYPVPPGHQAVDAGQADASGKFICTIEGSRFYSAPVAVGTWTPLRCDLVPLIAEALNASRTKGFLTNTKTEDLVLTSFNLGWEVPGTYDCVLHARHLALEAIPRCDVPSAAE